MRRTILLFIWILASQTLHAPLHAMVRAGVEVDHDDDGYYDDDDVSWGGPGFYYGIWFGNEADFYGYRRGYGRGYHHYHRDGGHGHGGGGHGGHGHGGGHH